MLVGHYIATFSRLRRKHSAAVRASDALGFTRSSRQLVYAAIARGAGNQLTFGLRSVKVDEWRAVDGLQGFQRACTLARNFQVVGAIPRHESRQELPDGCFVGMTRPAVEWKTLVHQNARSPCLLSRHGSSARQASLGATNPLTGPRRVSHGKSAPIRYRPNPSCPSEPYSPAGRVHDSQCGSCICVRPRGA